jgi:ribosomal protein S18 acetylase RimI-like enzyme
MSAAGWTIRPYRATDRAAVRALCVATADAGSPADTHFPDHELLADLVLRYHTDFEPQSLWVAEDAGSAVVGYAAGCLVPRAWLPRLLGCILPAAVWAAAGRGALGQRVTWRWLGAMLRTAWRRRGHRRPRLANTTGEVHVNCQAEARGRGLGHQLLERLLATARAQGLTGVRASVRADNRPARAFFERQGFRPLAQLPLVMPVAAGYTDCSVVIYGKQLSRNTDATD